jgi:hypothetical protein
MNRSPSLIAAATLAGALSVLALAGCAGAGGIAGAQPSFGEAPPAAATPAWTPPAPVQVAQAPAVQAAPAPTPAPPASTGTAADPWPRQLDLSNGTMLVYQPQVQSWKGNRLDFRSAVALLPHDGKGAETYGVIFATAMTTIDKFSRTVYMDEVSVYEIRFPTLPDNGSAYLPGVKQTLPTALGSMSLDRLQASLAASGTVDPPPVQVNNTPPAIVVRYGPALLVSIAGAPVVRSVPDTAYERVINTQALIVRPQNGGVWYLKVYDGWLSSPDITGAKWVPAYGVPAALNGLAQRLARSGVVDLLDGGPNATPKPTLADGAPQIVVATQPTELIVFKGQPGFVTVAGTALLWASNTAADVFIDNTNSYYYVLIAGRWYTAPDLAGPWAFVPPNGLPPDFARIPPGSPAGVVLASVAGTPQAKEALIADAIPQTAAISRVNGPAYRSTFDGAPQFAPIAGTPLQYAVNSPTPVIQVDAVTYYAVTGGVWFTASSAYGPWYIATYVPPAIYTIPPASPLHYVTYVRIYDSTPTTVYVGYTPGYLGTVVAPGGVVVYGTGYAYSPWIGTTYYPPPVTYGVAAAPVYNPAVGWTFGFALGMATAAMAVPYWGGAYYHAGWYGYPCCGSASANVYRNWGTGTSYGSRTWYSNSDGTVGTYGSGSYANRNTSGYYSGGRSYNPYTGQENANFARTGTTAGGASGSVSRSGSYNVYSGQGSYGSSGSVTGPGGSSVSRNVSASASPGSRSYDATTTTYNSRTGQTNTWNNGVPSSNNHYADASGNTYRSTGQGWQQHGAAGWGAASGSTSWADAEQQARSTGESRSNAFASSGGGFDRTGSGGGDWSSRFGSGGFGSSGSSWGSRFGSSGGDRFGGYSGWGDRFSSSSFGDRFGGGSAGGRFGGFGGGRFGGFRR